MIFGFLNMILEEEILDLSPKKLIITAYQIFLFPIALSTTLT